MGGVERRLRRLEELNPAPVEGYDDLPIEQWTAEIMRGATGPALYGDETLFYSWLEGLGNWLGWALRKKIAEARGEPTEGLLFDWKLDEEVTARVAECLPEHIEHWRVIFDNARPQRERKARASEKYDAIHRPDPRAKNWQAGAERERQRLAREYADWPHEWAEFYTTWKETHGR